MNEQLNNYPRHGIALKKILKTHISFRPFSQDYWSQWLCTESAKPSDSRVTGPSKFYCDIFGYYSGLANLNSEYPCRAAF